MSSAQNETFSPRNTAVLGGLLLLAVFLGEVVFNPLDKAGMSKPDTLDDIAMRLKPVVSLDLLRNSAAASIYLRDGRSCQKTNTPTHAHDAAISAH